LAFALYLFEVSAKPRQSRNLEEVKRESSGQKYLVRGVPPIKGEIKNP
jgi:hypothetical protein